MILVISPVADVHTRAVTRELDARGEPVRVLDMAALGDDATITFREGGARSIRWRAGGDELDLADVHTVWYRRTSDPRRAAAVRDPDEARFVVNEWRELFVGALLAMGCRFVNPPARQAEAVKPYQLRLAREAGLAIPETLITNCRAEAERFVVAHDDVLHKTLSAPLQRFLYTKAWRAEDARHLDTLALAPTIFQRRVPGELELRVTVIGAQVFAAAFRPRAGETDGRTDLDLAYDPYPLPAGVEAAIQRLMAALGLVYGTIDMRVTPDGDHVFLEINPQGQFLYVEIMTGMPLAAAMASLLADARGHR